MGGISNFDIEEIFNKGDNQDLLKNFVGVFSSDKMNKFFDFKEMMKGKRYQFLLANTDRSDKQGTHWWSILDIDRKKDFLLLDSFGIKSLKTFIPQDDKTILTKILKGLENLKERKSKVNLVKVNFVKNSYNKLSEDEKVALSETCLDFSHFIESFPEYENHAIIHLWLLADPIQDLKTDTCGYFQISFYENLFFPNSDSILQNQKRLTYDVIQAFLQELFSTNVAQNEKVIDLYIREKNGNVHKLTKLI